MTVKNIFEVATRGKLRFAFKGLVSVEDLWDLSVQDLDKIFKNLNAELKQGQEESLLNVKTKENEVLETKVEIVKYIVAVKQAEANAKVNEKARKEELRKIDERIAAKENEALDNLSLEDLKAMRDKVANTENK